MIKKYITVSGLSNNVSIIDGDREVDQGSLLTIIIDKHLEVDVVFNIIKRNVKGLVLVSKGLVSILGDNSIIVLSGPKTDQVLFAEHILGFNTIISVTKFNCFYTHNITKPNIYNKRYSLGLLPYLLKIVSTIS